MLNAALSRFDASVGQRCATNKPDPRETLGNCFNCLVCALSEALLSGGQRRLRADEQDERGGHYCGATTCHLPTVVCLPRLKVKEAHKSRARRFGAPHHLA